MAEAAPLLQLAALGSQPRRAAALGAALALAGVGLLELLIALGLRPLSPAGLPGFGMLVGAALCGWVALGAGGLVVLGYVALQALAPERFEFFFASGATIASWLLGEAVLGALLAALRTRLDGALRNALRMAADEVARAGTERLRAVYEAAPVGIAIVERDGRISDVNERFCEILGAPAAQLLGRSVEEITHRDDWAEDARLARELEAGRIGRFAIERRLLRGDGSAVAVLLSVSAERDRSGAIVRRVAAIEDVSELSAAQQALRESEARFRAVTDNAAALISYVDRGEVFRFNNRTWEDWLGVPLEEITGRTVREVLGNESYRRFRPYLEAALGGARTTFEAVLLRDGSERQVQGTYVPDLDAEGRVRGIYGMVSDVSRLKEVEARLARLAHFDVVTGVANRALFEDRLRQAIARARRSGEPLALLYLDIDRFKETNDRFGHAAGDALLKEFSTRVAACVRQSDTVARVGGDEFAVIVESAGGAAEVARLAARIIGAAAAPIRAGRDSVAARASIGIALLESGETREALLKRADAALYEAKAAGRNTWRIAA